MASRPLIVMDIYIYFFSSETCGGRLKVSKQRQVGSIIEFYIGERV